MPQALALHSTAADVTPQSSGPYLAFTNPGNLDINLVKLLGVSVKESNDPIGFFGTGLKYAMAAGHRLGGSMTIITGGITYEVGGRGLTLRDKAFTQITLNGEPLGFTSELGKQWEAWMVVRELYSNALDEGGKSFLRNREPTPDGPGDDTTVILRGGCFVDVWKEREKYFLALDRDVPVERSPHLEAYEARQLCNSVFYRGILVKATEQPTLYKYNLTRDVILTEDRTLKYDFQFREALEKAVIASNDRDFVRRVLTAAEHFTESHLPFSDKHYDIELSETFASVCGELLERMPANTNRRALLFYQARTQSQEVLVPVELTRVQTIQLSRAIAFVKRIGCHELDSFPLQVVRWLGEGIHGRSKDGMIHISVDCFDKGTKYLASTIFEEYVHCKYNLDDETRQLQTWLFDRIITMGEEHVTGEPL